MDSRLEDGRSIYRPKRRVINNKKAECLKHSEHVTQSLKGNHAYSKPKPNETKSIKHLRFLFEGKSYIFKHSPKCIKKEVKYTYRTQ